MSRKRKTNLCSTMFFKDIHWKTGWWFQIFGIFTPIVGEMIQFEEHIFPMGWNNQLALLLPSPLVVDGTLKLPKIQKIGKFSYGPIAFFVWRGCVFDILINVGEKMCFLLFVFQGGWYRTQWYGDSNKPSYESLSNSQDSMECHWRILNGARMFFFQMGCNQQVLGCPAGT